MTVVVLTSGTTYAIPPDWSNTNQVECWAAGGGGGGNTVTSAGGGGGSGGYSSVSNLAGLSGTLTIGIGTGGTGGAFNVDGTAGGATWFNGASLAASSVGANGGGLGAAAGGVGAGGSTTGAVGTTTTAGASGGAQFYASPIGAGGGGAGAPGPAGVGAAGGAAVSTATAGSGGTGDNTSGGAGGAGASGTTTDGTAGTANTNGGGGGGAGNGQTPGTGGNNGANGGLPGAGGGGGGSGPGAGNGGAGGGGQIRITYTPAVTSYNSLVSTALPPAGSNQVQKGPTSPTGYDYLGWKSSPLAPDTAMGHMWREVPPGRYNPFNYMDWQRAPQGAPTNRPSLVYDLPVRTWTTRSFTVDFLGWFQSPIPAEFLVPLSSTAAPKGVYNTSAYQDWNRTPQPLGLQPNLAGVSWGLPLTLDPRQSYAGIQSGPRPQTTQVPTPSPWTDVPKGIWSITAYQFHTAGYQRAEYTVPPSVSSVPQGAVLYDYSGWSRLQMPIQGPVPIQSSRSTELPPVSSLTTGRNSIVYFQGAQSIPGGGTPVSSSTVCWLPLVYVGNTPIPGGNIVISPRLSDTVHGLPPAGANLRSWIYGGTQVSPPLIDNAGSATSAAVDVPRGMVSDRRWDYSGMQSGPLSIDNAISFGNRSTTVPMGVRDDGRYAYRGTQQKPSSTDSLIASTSYAYTVPQQTRDDRRWDYSGVASGPGASQPNVVLGPLTVAPLIFSSNVADVPAGVTSNPRWNYAGTQVAPQGAPSILSNPRAWVEVPPGRISDKRFDYAGTQKMPTVPSLLMLGPMMLGVPMVPTPMTDLPVRARNTYAYLGGQRGPGMWE